MPRHWRGRAGKKPRKPGEPNSLERAWGEVLEARKAANEILDYTYEPEALRIAWKTETARGSTYCPDFRVVMPDGEIRFHEVKGFMRDDAKLKIKLASNLHPYRFFLVTKKGGVWKEEEI